MDHIFGDSHDIAFGGKAQSGESPRPSVRPERRVHQDDFQDLAPVRPHSVRPPKPRQQVSVQNEHRTSAPLRKDTPPQVEQAPLLPLARLVDGMKPSFLPKEEDTNIVRLIALSSAEVRDPLFLMNRDDTTILMGSGFGTTTVAGSVYPTFPDMRLVVSETARLSAWILTDPMIDVSLFQTILPVVGFPPIYGTRDIIAHFRNNIKDTAFLEKCRFFELFTDDVSERRIGHFDFSLSGGLRVRSGQVEWTFALPQVTPISGARILTIHDQGYMLGDISYVSGEIMTLSGREIRKHAMKFTFDTFYTDKNSVGVVAGYTLSDREQLAENGVLIFTLEEDTRARTILGHIFIDSRGFVHAHEMMYVHKEILKGIRTTYEKLLVDNPKIERGELVQSLRREITKYCYLLTGRTPVVMPVVIAR